MTKGAAQRSIPRSVALLPEHEAFLDDLAARKHFGNRSAALREIIQRFIDAENARDYLLPTNTPERRTIDAVAASRR